MKIDRKFHKGGHFEKPSNVHFMLRIDTLKRIKSWTDEEFNYAVAMLENDCIKDIQRFISQMKQARATLTNKT